MELGKRDGTPYGEARRLRYISEICNLLTDTGNIDATLLTERIKSKADDLEQLRTAHIRISGKIGTRNVAHNYIEFSRWLEVINRSGHLASPNGYTLLFSEIYGGPAFRLTNEEKIAFFQTISRKGQVIDVLASLKRENYVKDTVKKFRQYGEHFIETFFEWFVDLGILKTSTSSSREFYLTATGESLVNEMEADRSDVKMTSNFCSSVLRRTISNDAESGRFVIDSTFKLSFKTLQNKTRSELGNNLYTALPILLYMQSYLIVKHNLYLRVKDIAALLSESKLSSIGHIHLNWEDASRKGHIVVLGDVLDER
jgi:hypothetical protein